MQLTVRSYLMAGFAAAGAGALAIAPMPSLTSDITIPSVEAPVALAAAPSAEQLLALGIADTAGLAGGIFGSGASANTFLGYDTQVLGQTFAALPALIANDPETYLPIAAVGVATLPITLATIAEPQFTGVNAGGQNQLPGQAATTSPIGIPTNPFFQNVPTVVAPINAATKKVANDFDNVSAALGGPKLANPITVGAQEVGTGIVQAQGLVRTAGVGTLSAATQAALARNPQGVATAFQNAPGALQKAVFGDPAGPNIGGAPSVKKLGAIGTVSATVKKAADNIGNAVSGGS
jgi:hypothetical protein